MLDRKVVCATDECIKAAISGELFLKKHTVGAGDVICYGYIEGHNQDIRAIENSSLHFIDAFLLDLADFFPL